MGVFDGVPLLATPKPKEPNYFVGLGQSTLSSIPELFGVRPAPEVEAFRASHPVSGIVSQLAGTAVPYGGWFKASKAIKGFDTLVEGIGDLKKAPILTAAAREAARFAPFEAARVGIASGFNHQPLGEELGSSAINLGLGAVVGGAFAGIKAAGPASKLLKMADISSAVDTNAPIQIQMRQLQEELSAARVPPAYQSEALSRLNRWRVDARREEPGPTSRYLARLDGESSDREVSRALERSFFRPDEFSTYRSSGKGTLTRTFTATGKGFKDETSWQQAAQDFGLPEDFPQLTQYPRAVRADSEKAAKALLAQARKLTPVGDWFISREADDGLFVMLKRIGGEKPAPGDRWLALKTDAPGTLAPELESWNKTLDGHLAWLPETSVPDDVGGAAFKFARNFQKEIPFQDYTAGQKTGKVEALLKKTTGEFGQRAVDFTTYLLTPAINQTVRNPKANYITKAAQLMFDNAEQRATDALLGARPLGDAKGILSVALGNAERSLDGGIEGRIRALSDEQFSEFMDAWRVGAKPEDLEAMHAAGKIDAIVKDLYPELERIVTGFAKSRAETAKLSGDNSFKELIGHGGLSRQWEGSIKIGLMDESGNLAAIADGFYRKDALKRAEFIKDEMAKEGKVLHIGQEWDTTQAQRIPRDLGIVESRPGFLEARSGVRGFKWDFGVNPSKDELISAYSDALKTRAKSEANIAWKALFNDDLSGLATSDPTMFNVVTDRFNAMSGQQDEVTKMLNQWADPLLGPTLGTNSASKVVAATNEFFWHLQLGALNVAYPVVNMIGTLQTVLPELAFVMSGTPERLAGYYMPQMVKGAKNTRGIMSVLDPIKLMGKATGLVTKPTEDFLTVLSRAVNDGTVDPKYVEEMVGQNSRMIGRFGDVLGGKEPFGKWLGAVSEYMPGMSERLSRGYSFAVGYSAGKDILGLEGEALFQFSKQFTDRTMYRYATADRPAVLTNPVGRLFGSMKNWMGHYLSNMLVYSDEALKGNVAPLAWQMATTGLIGGASSVPFLPGIANGFLSQTEDKNLMNWTYKAFGQQAGDGIYFGLPALMGVSLASATASPVRDANMLFSLAQWSRMESMGKAIGGGIDYWRATGQHPGKDPNTRGLLTRAMAPKTLYRFAQVYDNPGIESLSTGYPIIDQVNPWNKVLYTMGFNPNAIERGYAVFEQALKNEEEEKKKVSALGRAMSGALAMNDGGEVDSLLRLSMVEGIDPSRVMKSAASRDSAAGEDLLERNFQATQLGAFDAVLTDWNKK